MSARDRFEKFISESPFGLDIKRYPKSDEVSWPGQYCNQMVQVAWNAWQESAQTLPADPSQWTPLDPSKPQSYPDPGKKVIAAYRNSHGKWRRIMAVWTPAKFLEISADSGTEDSDYDENRDAYFEKEGWYEQIDNWDEYAYVRVHNVVSHWMPLPSGPEDSE